MDVREKLVEIIQNSVGGCARHWAEVIADGLIAHGVTVQNWISVDDRLPQNFVSVLGYMTDAGEFPPSFPHWAMFTQYRIGVKFPNRRKENDYAVLGVRKVRKSKSVEKNLLEVWEQKGGEEMQIFQKVKSGGMSICVSCTHRKVCKGIDNQPCVECNQFFNEDKQPQTNADRIRAMSDDDLAEFLCQVNGCYQENCPGAKLCEFQGGKANGLKKWLKQPAEGGTQ